MAKGKAKQASTPAANVFPGRLVPLSIYGSWAYGSWADLDETKGWFGYDRDTREILYYNRAKAEPKFDPRLVGELPEGLDCADLSCNESGDCGLFVGTLEDIQKAEAAMDARESADLRINEMMFG